MGCMAGQGGVDRRRQPGVWVHACVCEAGEPRSPVAAAGGLPTGRQAGTAGHALPMQCTRPGSVELACTLACCVSCRASARRWRSTGPPRGHASSSPPARSTSCRRGWGEGPALCSGAVFLCWLDEQGLLLLLAPRLAKLSIVQQCNRLLRARAARGPRPPPGCASSSLQAVKEFHNRDCCSRVCD